MRNYFPLNHASRESLKYANKLSFGRYISSELKKSFYWIRKIWLFDEVVFLDHFLHFLKLRFNAFQFFPPLPMHLTLCRFWVFWKMLSILPLFLNVHCALQHQWELIHYLLERRDYQLKSSKL